MLILFLNSCGPTPEQIEGSQLRLVDSIYYKEVKLLNKEMDSLCRVHYPEYLEDAIDSIETQIWEEIKKLRDEE